MFIEPHPPARLDWSGGQHSQHVVHKNVFNVKTKSGTA